MPSQKGQGTVRVLSVWPGGMVELHDFEDQEPAVPFYPTSKEPEPYKGKQRREDRKCKWSVDRWWNEYRQVSGESIHAE